MYLQIVGIITIIISVVIIFFRKSVSKSNLITVPAGFGGKSFQEKFGTEKGSKYMLYFGLLFLLLGLFVFFLGFFRVSNY